MSVSFVINILWPKNPKQQATGPFKLKVPGGVPNSHVRSPVFVDAPGMSAALKSGTTLAEGANNQLGTVGGLVTSKLEVRFENAQAQWKSRPVGGPDAKQGPVEFTFQGGKVLIDLTLGIFVMNANKPIRGDTTSAKIFSVAYSHELLHVFDNLDMIDKWFVPKLKAESMIEQFLERSKPWIFGRTTDSVSALLQEFPSFVRDKLQGEADYVWAGEANRRQAIRDAPAEYKKVQDQIDDLRSSYVRPK